MALTSNAYDGRKDRPSFLEWARSIIGSEPTQIEDGRFDTDVRFTSLRSGVLHALFVQPSDPARPAYTLSTREPAKSTVTPYAQPDGSIRLQDKANPDSFMKYEEIEGCSLLDVSQYKPTAGGGFEFYDWQNGSKARVRLNPEGGISIESIGRPQPGLVLLRAADGGFRTNDANGNVVMADESMLPKGLPREQLDMHRSAAEAAGKDPHRIACNTPSPALSGTVKALIAGVTNGLSQTLSVAAKDEQQGRGGSPLGNIVGKLVTALTAGDQPGSADATSPKSRSSHYR